jgi:hypothetical protein
MKQILILSPSAAIAQPRGWVDVSAMSPIATSRFDEIHCIGAGSLLLWLLGMAGRAPRAKNIYCHGPLVMPTARSCTEWLSHAGRGALADKYEWRSQAVNLGFNGQLATENDRWLEPLMRTIAAGRDDELVDDFEKKKEHQESRGRLIHRPAFELTNNGFANVYGGSSLLGSEGHVLLCKEDQCELVQASQLADESDIMLP